MAQLRPKRLAQLEAKWVAQLRPFYLATREELQIMLEIGYSETIVNEWLKCYDLMCLEFSSASDTVVLLKPSEIGV